MPIALGEPFSFDQSLPSEQSAAPFVTESRARVVILGAGLAGLTCGYRYAQSLGRPVTREDLSIIEREPSVGGRVRSLKIGEHVVNLGAVTFQPTAYPRYMALLDELALRDRVHIIPRRGMALGINGRALHANTMSLATDGISSLVGRGLFTPSEAIQLLRFYFYMQRVTSPAHFDELLALHDHSVAEWAQQFGFSESVKRKFVEPFIGFTFSAPEHISAAFGVLLLGFNLSQPANLVGGIMQVPEALARRLEGVIETNAVAMRVEREPEGFVTDYLQEKRLPQQKDLPHENRMHRIHSKALVVALPANAAAAILPEMRERASTVRYGNGHASILQGALHVPGELQLWRTDRGNEMVIYGGEAQPTQGGGQLLNLLTYRGENREDTVARMFVNGCYERLVSYSICPAVAAPEPNQKPMPLEWGDGLYMAGDCTGLFPSQEAAVSSGEQVARQLAGQAAALMVQ